MKVATIVGARPEFTKSGPVSDALSAEGIEEILVHTGQHYDREMSAIFFDALGLREPDHRLIVGSGSHGHQTGKMLAGIEDILVETGPDAVLVYGDTNSTLAGALAAAKLHIPVGHIEAGLRSFNRRMPEELNRICTDHLSTLLFCPTDVAVGHLATEGIVQGVHQVGDVMQDAVDRWMRTSGDDALPVEGVAPGGYYLATVHRAENVDDPCRLERIVAALDSLDAPVILPIHPRTRKALGDRADRFRGSLRVVDPVGYLEMLALVRSARAILTDSGGVQKEAYMMGVPCITLRDETEWTETVDSGWNTLTGADRDRIVAAVRDLRRPAERPRFYGDGEASVRIARHVRALLEDGVA
jgi:UDP-N-acetylglucosamine 2-epimerase